MLLIAAAVWLSLGLYKWALGFCLGHLVLWLGQRYVAAQQRAAVERIHAESDARLAAICARYAKEGTK